MKWVMQDIVSVMVVLMGEQGAGLVDEEVRAGGQVVNEGRPFADSQYCHISLGFFQRFFGVLFSRVWLLLGCSSLVVNFDPPPVNISGRCQSNLQFPTLLLDLILIIILFR